MIRDIKRARAITNGNKIITKHEWMAAALETIEKVNESKSQSNRREEPG